MLTDHIFLSALSLKPGECHGAHITPTKMDAAAATLLRLQLNDFSNLLHQTRPAASRHNAYLSRYCGANNYGSHNLFVHIYPEDSLICQEHCRFTVQAAATAGSVLFYVSMMWQNRSAGGD